MEQGTETGRSSASNPKRAPADPFAEPPHLAGIRAAVAGVCAEFPDRYWRDLDTARAYPEAFVRRLTESKWLSALIPVEFGGLGYGITEAAAILEEVNRQGGNSGPAHAQMYVMGTLLRHGSSTLKQRYLPSIADGSVRLQAFGVTEPEAGSDTTRIATRAERVGNTYRINGRKIYISRIQHSDLMLLLARTAPRDDSQPTKGLSLFLVDLRRAGTSVTSRPLRMLMNNETNEVTLSDLDVPADHLVGIEGEGFRHILDGWNAERILIAAECVGDGRWFTERAARYASERIVFDRKLGSNQGIQFPIAAAYARIEAAALVQRRAASRFDAGLPSGADANMAKYLASEASWAAANACVDTLGGNGFNAEFDVERKFRETRLYRVAPVSNNLVLAFIGHRVLGMPKSY
ncbi:MAG: acyl-CoA/acyl-ACP dehydrogenase [Chloroflexota bacterium]|nr:acyl-CoA/acyl-ACP dehydrogenase [Chloroflexota bacterium]